MVKKNVIEVYSPYVINFCWVKEEPFLSLSVKTIEKEYSEKDFICVRFNDRIEKVPRYSVQRTFEENYIIDGNRELFYDGIINYPIVETVEVELPKLLDNYLHLPKLNKHYPIDENVDSGYVRMGELNKYIPLYDRCHLEVDLYGGFPLSEVEDNIYDEVKYFDYTKEKTSDSIYK